MKGQLMKLNIGCGNKKLEGYINIDKQPSADVCLDLEGAILPYGNNSIDIILASHVFEHIQNLIPLVNECHRVLKPGGVLNIAVPNVEFLEAFQDPTHIRFFTEATWRYWLKDDFYFEECGKGYGILPFSKMAQAKQGFQLTTQLTK